ncbi:MAG: hypothetical protein V4807_01015 [Burkholderia gladioli]|nr:hypothetical protein [Burkholderia gladioli]
MQQAAADLDAAETARRQASADREAATEAAEQAARAHEAVELQAAQLKTERAALADASEQLAAAQSAATLAAADKAAAELLAAQAASDKAAAEQALREAEQKEAALEQAAARAPAEKPAGEATAADTKLVVARPAQDALTLAIGGREIPLTPVQLSQLIEELAHARASMTPEQPSGLPTGWRFVSTRNPMMAVQKQANGDRLLVARHTGYGWVPFTFSPDTVIQMYMLLTQ